jgi:acyl-CoA reductase-like NAD-dependent aldehyde dehydrogenase
MPLPRVLIAMSNHVFPFAEVAKPLSTAAVEGNLDDRLSRILQTAANAQTAFAKLSQEEADMIFDAVAHEANKHRVPLAKLAVEETGVGCFEDKVIKNGIAW